MLGALSAVKTRAPVLGGKSCVECSRRHGRYRISLINLSTASFRL